MSGGRVSLRVLAGKIELGALTLLLLAPLALGPYAHVRLPGSGWRGFLCLLLIGAALTPLLLGPVARHAARALSGLPARLRIARILALGAALQVCIALLTHPQVNSDPAVYVELATRLAHGQGYQDSKGMLAFWPPGLPLFLAPFMRALGTGFAAIVTANLVLYVIGALASWQLGKQLFGAPTGLMAAFLFSIWPSRVLSSGFASKENLTIAMCLAGTALCVHAFALRSGKGLAVAAAAGIAFGLAGLAQPGLLLFVAAVPVAYRYALPGLGGWRFFARCSLVIACMAATLAPWQIRNCLAFQGNFCGVATNGGSVFYRANNPLATGLFTAHGEIRIDRLPELEQNRLGFILGKAWIREHPAGFIKLAGRKLMYLVEDDRYGAYWAILRGDGKNNLDALEESPAARTIAFHVAEWLSWAFWALTAAWTVRLAWPLARRPALAEQERLAPLVYPMLYCAAIFSVFESGSRQHAIAMATLLIVAAASIMRSRRRDRGIDLAPGEAPARISTR